MSEAFDGKMPEQLENASEESGGDDDEDDNTTDDDGTTVCHMPIIVTLHIWAMACDFQQCGILTSVESEKPV